VYRENNDNVNGVQQQQPKTIATQNVQNWSYSGEFGPEAWSDMFPDARGSHQSPINIITSESVFDQILRDYPLMINYNPACSVIIKNTGRSFEVKKEFQPDIFGGPLNNRYRFLQMHMHWGKALEQGSEHLVDGCSYASEIHLVNWNYELFKTPEEAARSSNHSGLAVLGVFVKVGQFNPDFQKIVDSVNDIKLKDNAVITDNLNLCNFLPSNKSDYWTYEGSLTTPPCSESVRWIVFRQPIEISPDQLKQVRNLHESTDTTSDLLHFNNRPICRVGDRTVFRSFYCNDAPVRF
jgi:carbonic anhydrase